MIVHSFLQIACSALSALQWDISLVNLMVSQERCKLTPYGSSLLCTCSGEQAGSLHPGIACQRDNQMQLCIVRCALAGPIS